MNLKTIFSFGLLFCALCPMLSAAGSETEASPLDFVWKVINFVILIGIIYWFAKKPISEALKSSAENAKSQLEQAREMETRALAQMKEMREKLLGLEKESKEMVKKARLEAQAEKERILEEGKLEIERIHEQALVSIEQEYRKAEYHLRHWVATESVKLAEDKLKDKMSVTRQDKLINEYLDRLNMEKETS